MKTNGCGFGTAYSYYGETFFATPATPKLVLGEAYHYTIIKSGTEITAKINGTTVVSGNYPSIYNTEAAIGLYCEESKVEVFSVALTVVD